MSVNPKNLYRFVVSLLTLTLVIVLASLAYTDYWHLVTEEPRTSTIAIWLAVLAGTLLLLILHLREEEYYPKNFFRRVLTFLLFVYLILGYTNEWVSSFWIAIVIAIFLPMPSILIITTVSAVSLIGLYHTAMFMFSKMEISSLSIELLSSFANIEYFLPIIAFGFSLAIVSYFFLKGKQNFQAYANNYSFVVGFVTSLLSVVLLVVMAFVISIYAGMYYMLAGYAKHLKIRHFTSGKGREHYLETKALEQFKLIMLGNLQSAKKYFTNAIKFLPKNYGSHRSLFVRIYVAIFMVMYALLSFISRSIIVAVIAACHGLVLLIVKMVYLATKKIVSLSEVNFRKKYGVRAVCDSCYHEDDLPNYQCTSCGKIHDIRPGIYGVFKYRCACGTKLPNTFNQGRQQLKAFCKSCGDEYFHQESVPVIIPILGETSVGKTKNVVNGFAGILEETKYRNIQCGFISDQHAKEFDEIANNLVPTVTKEPKPSTLHFISNKQKPNVSMHVFDSAGSAYDNLEEIRSLKYLHLADGFVFLLDGKNLVDEFSEIGDTLERLIMYWQKESNEKSEVRFTTPIAFVFNQMDAVELGDFRPEAIRQWLNANGFADLVRKIDMTFETYEFFCANSQTITGEYSPDKAYNWLMNRHHNLNLGGMQ